MKGKDKEKMSECKKYDRSGKDFSGIEFGSTRIKAVLVGEDEMHRLLREAMNGRTVLTTVSGLTH